jgi:hypothetical protein
MEGGTKESISDGAPLSEPFGLDALYVPVMAPDVSEKVLQFQWMRMHPFTAIALCNDNESPSVQVARTISAYQAAMSPSPTNPVTSSFCRARQVRVDLCDLFDPPLLSGNHFTICKDESMEDSCPSSPKRMRQNEVESSDDTLTMVEVMRQILGAALAELENKCHDPISTGLHQFFSTMTEDDLLETLPSHWMREKIQERVSNESVSFPQLSIRAMTLLSEHAACQVFGKYVVSACAPEILCTAKLSDVERKPVFLLLRRLADTLVTRCFLGKLPKEELLRRVAQSSHMPNSEGMDELIVCIGEAYDLAIMAYAKMK